MSKTSSLLFGFLFLKGGPVKKSTLLSLLDIHETELSPHLLTLKREMAHIPLTLLESDISVELTLNSELTLLFDSYIKKESEGDLSPSLIETLAAIAYTEKPTKFLISYIRGVSATQSLASLIAKDLVEEDSNGIYHLTTKGLSHLGVTTKKELPSYAELQKELSDKIINHEEK